MKKQISENFINYNLQFRTEVQQNLDRVSLGRLALIYNVSLSLGYIHKRWRGATAVLIPKMGKSDRSSSQSFCRISLTSFLFKGSRGWLHGIWRRLLLLMLHPNTSMPSGKVNPRPLASLRQWTQLNLLFLGVTLLWGFSLMRGHLSNVLCPMSKPPRFLGASGQKVCHRTLLSGIVTI